MMLSPKLSTTLSYESLHCVHWTRDLFKKHWYIQYFCCGRCICIQGNDPKGLQTTSAKWKLSVYICVTSKTNRPISELGTFKKTDHNRVVVLYMSVVTMVSLDSRNGNDIVPGSQKSNTFFSCMRPWPESNIYCVHYPNGLRNLFQLLFFLLYILKQRHRRIQLHLVLFQRKGNTLLHWHGSKSSQFSGRIIHENNAIVFIHWERRLQYSIYIIIHAAQLFIVGCIYGKSGLVF